MQMGFAGLSVILLAIICWLIHSKDITLDKVMELQRETNRVVERNTAAMQELSRVVHDKFFRSEK